MHGLSSKYFEIIQLGLVAFVILLHVHFNSKCALFYNYALRFDIYFLNITNNLWNYLQVA
jgi:hypothetical protein